MRYTLICHLIRIVQYKLYKRTLSSDDIPLKNQIPTPLQTPFHSIVTLLILFEKKNRKEARAGEKSVFIVAVGLRINNPLLFP